ncbi:30S ribosome-binding factor RbfA [Ructibacterium gallinarum]|uniref:Ribosome-binding factor A n=1 Tax=Ructibacterium gallinarum TaxID=2779355 RepID=A0A9D5M2H4_9FIRM|nr:30S ribosome-binding factor RbfA [Ructibacterium gallinarum]MBE5040926.1 30S ribosome-binding factor RbfA [Ructibacterium gallinarum]
MANYSRIDRISEEVKRELSAVIRDLKDPRLPAMVSVVNVRVTKDLKFAKAYISIMGDEKTVKDGMEALKSAGGFIRREIGHRLNLRNTPEFTFVADDSIAYGSHINEILKEL